MDYNFDFLEINQIYDFRLTMLGILKKYGEEAAITDFSILLGGEFSNVYTLEGKSKKDRAGIWWTKTPYLCGCNRMNIIGGNNTWTSNHSRHIGARPSLPYSSISSVASNEVRDKFEIKEVEYGEYPQMIVDKGYSRELEKLYISNNLKETGKKYTTDSVCYIIDKNATKSFIPREHIEYEHNGRKYIRVVADLNCHGKKLSDGRKIYCDCPYWIKVEPIKWLVDEEANLALSKKILFAGIQFQNEYIRRDKDGFTYEYTEIIYDKTYFDKINIKKFMDNYFAKEILTDWGQSQVTSVNNEQAKIQNEVPVKKKVRML